MHEAQTFLRNASSLSETSDPSMRPCAFRSQPEAGRSHHAQDGCVSLR